MGRSRGRRNQAVVVHRPRALVAAASPITLDGTSWRSWKLGDQRWQEEAWRHYDICGELRFATGWISNAVSRCRLYVAELDKYGRPGKETADDQIQILSETMFGGPALKAEALRSIAAQLYVSGESYIVAEEVASASKDIWYVCSSSEVTRVGTDQIEVMRSHMHGGGRYRLRPGKDLIIRTWTPHIRRYDAPDSSVRAVLPVLREIEQLTKKVFAQIDSRLAGAGMLFLPQEVDFPRGDKDPPGLAGLAMIIERAISQSLQDQASPSSLAPILVGVAAEYIDKIKWQTFETPFQAETAEKLTQAIRRLATGLDIPPEVLLGQGDSNHWSAWQIEESTIKVQVEPLLVRICDALTSGYLKSALKILGKDEDQYVVWYDTAPLVVRPNRQTDAIELFKLGVLSAEETRTAGAWPESGKPNKKEYERTLADKVIALRPDLIGNEDIQKALGIDWTIEDPNAAPPEEVAPEDEEVPPEDDGGAFNPFRALPDMPADSETPAQEAALLVGADMIVRRALERAGARLLTRARKASGEFASIPAGELHTVIAVPNEEMPRLLADAFVAVPELANRVRMDAAVVEDMLTVYVAALITRSERHDYKRFAIYVDQALDLIGHSGCGRSCRNPLHPGDCRGKACEFCRAPLHPGPCADPTVSTQPRPRLPRRDDPGRRLPSGAGSGKADPSAAIVADLEAADLGDAAAQERVVALARQAYGFTDPDTGLTTEVTGVSKVAHSPRGAGLVFDVQVKNANGEVVGHVKRTWRSKAGKMSVRHSSFVLDDDVQGGGFSRRFNDQAYRSYAQMGVPYVTLTANDTVGGAAWAAEGYDFVSKDDMKYIAKRFQRLLQGLQDGPTKSAIQSLLARSTDADWAAGTHPSPYEWYMIGAEAPRPRQLPSGKTYQTWTGKDALMETTWEGVLAISEVPRPGAGPRTGPLTAAAGREDESNVYSVPIEEAAVDAWRERAEFLAEVRRLSLAYADETAGDVDADVGAFTSPEGGVNDYPEHHHLFGSDQDQAQVYVELANELLTQWGRTGEQQALVAHAGCQEGEFCRNPLHPGPCRGWRRQKDVPTGDRRDKTPAEAIDAQRRRRAAKATPAKAAPPPVKVAPPPVARESVPDPDRPVVSPHLRSAIADSLQAGGRLPTPEAKAAVEQLWNVDDPVSGLSSTVTSVSQYADYGERTLIASIQIRDRNGAPVGTSTRHIRMPRRGTSMSVYHAYLQISSRTQGGGFASRYNDQAFRGYAEMGVTGVEVHANIDVGGYTWATQGFDFQGRSDLAIFTRRFETFRSSLDRIAHSADPNGRQSVAGQQVTPAEARRLRDELDALLARSTDAHWQAGTHPTPFEYSQFGSWLSHQRVVGAGRSVETWLGKSILLGSSWHGRRPITRRTRRGTQPVPGVPQAVKKTAKRAAKKATKATTTAAIEDVPMEMPEPEITEAREEQYDFLDAIWEVYLAYAQLMGDTVPAYPEDATPNEEGGTEYPAAQHMISANPDQTRPWLEAVEELLDMWGRGPEQG